MRPAAALLILGLVWLLVAAAAPTRTVGPFPVTASAPSSTLTLVSDRAVAGRGDVLNFTIWLNVTGNGQFQRTWVNLTFNTAAMPSQNSLSQGPLPWTQPAACAYVVASSWFLEWQCVGLRAGAYQWGVPAYVPGNASVGHEQRVVASTYSAIGPGNVSAVANGSVWIAGALLRILDVESSPATAAHPGAVIEYWINASNDANPNAPDANVTGTALHVNVTVELDAGLHPGTGFSNLTTRFASLPPGAVLTVNLEAIVASTITPGTSVGIHVLIRYEDFNGHPIGPLEGESSPIYVVQPNVLSASNLVAGAAIGLAAILTTLMVLLYAGQRKIVIDEAFLMTKGGLLIRHVSREAGLQKDDDIVASMFVAIQEFVRDSFRREASLDSVAFGNRRAAVVRGELTILAAVISHGDPEAVTPELLASVRAIESRYWDVLRSWDGNLASLGGVDAVLARLMQGEFRAPWRVQLA
jgi:hypothetical protein